MRRKGHRRRANPARRPVLAAPTAPVRPARPVLAVPPAVKGRDGRRRWRWPRGLRRWRRDRGSATVELAVSLPALVLLLLAALTAVTAVRVQAQCVDAAREAARAAARGEPGEPAGRRVAPDGASISLSRTDDTVQATVTVHIAPLGGRLPGFDVTGSAVAALEPGVGDG